MADLKGVGVALVTPFKANGSVDCDALERVIDYTIKGQVNYLVVLGTTGEASTLTADEKKTIINCAYEKGGNRTPIVVGVGGNNTQEVIENIKSLPLEKASAILSVTPYYNKPSQEGIYQHFAAIARSTDKNIILYNVPGRTSVNISAETTIRLAQDFKNIIGIKEASGNMVQCMRLVKDAPEGFLLISGDDHLTLPLIACGFHGVISVAANCVASTFSQMVHRALDGEFAIARKIHFKMLDVMDLLFAENNPAGVKAFMAEMHLIENYLRLPLVPLSESLHEKVRLLSEN
jgi:4-hydroxy-tetrahydrodipicolinate synthase